jgi:8-amino-7-oxononanoate synthase
VLNFTSSSYLGLNHDPEVRERTAAIVRHWGSSLAMPRLLASDVLTARLERELAGLVGAEATLLFPSTLHAAHDVLRLLAGAGGVIAIDERAYPISLAAARSVAWPDGSIMRFRHDDPGSLAEVLSGFTGRDAVAVCDGVYPASGRSASLDAIGHIAARAGATVYLDDAHGLGVLGANPSRAQPYGHGGGGTLLHNGASPGNIAYVSSLSKGLSVPLAFAAGPARFIDYLRITAASVTHSSPPAVPVVAAALATLQRHAECGDELRGRLLNNVRSFRAGVRRLGLPLTSSSLFQIKSVAFASPAAALASGRQLRRHGIWPVIALYPEDHPTGAVLRFVITAAHSDADIEQAIDALFSLSHLRRVDGVRCPIHSGNPV